MPRILLLDDEFAVARALSLLLQALGFEVTECTDPEQALAHLAGQVDGFPTAATGDDVQPESAPLGEERSSGVYDLFLCDLRMPRKDGLAVLKECHALYPSIPVVLMSGHASTLEMEIAKKLGAADFLQKPFSVDQLKATLAKLRIEASGLGTRMSSAAAAPK